MSDDAPSTTTTPDTVLTSTPAQAAAVTPNTTPGTTVEKSTTPDNLTSNTTASDDLPQEPLLCCVSARNMTYTPNHNFVTSIMVQSFIRLGGKSGTFPFADNEALALQKGQGYEGVIGVVRSGDFPRKQLRYFAAVPNKQGKLSFMELDKEKVEVAMEAKALQGTMNRCEYACEVHKDTKLLGVWYKLQDPKDAYEVTPYYKEPFYEEPSWDTDSNETIPDPTMVS
jgi:hypothetical protein